MFAFHRGIATAFTILYEGLELAEQYLPGWLDVEDLLPSFSSLMGGRFNELDNTGIMEAFDLNVTDNENSLGLQEMFGALGGFDKNLGNFHFRAFNS